MYSSLVLKLAGSIHSADSQITAITRHDAIVYLPCSVICLQRIVNDRGRRTKISPNCLCFYL